MTGLATAGCPDGGYMEMKAEDLVDRTAIIITLAGTVTAPYKIGLGQGSPWACDNALLVSNMQMKLHNAFINDFISSDPRDSIIRNNTLGYKFHNPDSIKNCFLTIISQTYSDDALRTLQHDDAKILIRALQLYINLTGHFSIVTKLGRKGSKSSVTIFNMKTKDIMNVPTFKSIAWSFKDDGVITENLELVIHTIDHRDSLDDTIDYVIDEYKNLSNQQLEVTLQKIKDHSPYKTRKHLGVTGYFHNLEYNKTFMSQKKKFEWRFGSLRVNDFKGPKGRVISNSLITSVFGFAILFLNPKEDEIEKLENKIAIKAGKECLNLTYSDAKHLVFIEHKHGGAGITSISYIFTVGKVRELMVALNDFSSSLGMAHRTRHDAQNDQSSNICVSPILYNNTKWLDKFGIYLADKREIFTCIVLQKFLKLSKSRAVPIGVRTTKNKFSSSCSNHCLTRGNPILARYGMYELNYKFVRKLIKDLIAKDININTNVKNISKMMKETARICKY